MLFLGQNFNQKRKIFIYFKKINKIKLIILKEFRSVLLCLYVADPATFVASNSDLGTLFPLRTVC